MACRGQGWSWPQDTAVCEEVEEDRVVCGNEECSQLSDEICVNCLEETLSESYLQVTMGW